MKNPFKKDEHTLTITAVAVGAVAAGALAYLFLTEKGDEILAGIGHQIKDKAKDVASGLVSEKTGISKKTVKKGEDIISE